MPSCLIDHITNSRQTICKKIYRKACFRHFYQTRPSFFIDNVSESNADVVVSIGKDTAEVRALNDATLSQFGRKWGVRNGVVYVDGKSLESPYSGLVGTYQLSAATKPRVFIYGNRIEGTIAALKEFISAREVFFNPNAYSGTQVTGKKLVILDKFDTSAIRVYDLFHNSENGLFFTQQKTQAFADVVADVLNDDNFGVGLV